MNLTSKLPQVGTTIFTIMSQLATDHDAINLGQGFPNFNPDDRLIDGVTAAMRAGHNQYPPMAGIPLLRENIAKKIQTLYGHSYDPASEITVTSGASEALLDSILASVHDGDEVIIIEPFYDLYIPAITLAGGIPVIVPMTAPDAAQPRYRVDWDRVSDAITDKTRMLILNFPHNPTCINLREDDLDVLEAIVARTGIILLSDEVYEHIVFDGDIHRSLCRRPLLAEHAIIVSSFGKTFHMTGWKIGYCCAPSALMAEIRKVHQFNVFTVSTPMQIALADFMTDAEQYRRLPRFYEEKRNRLAQGLKNTRLVPLESESTFFLLASYQGVSEQAELEFSRWLTTEKGVAVIPVSAFYLHPDAPESNHQLVRFCFAKDNATLDKAVALLSSL